MSEKLRSKSQRPSSPNDQIYADLQCKIHESFKMYQVAAFVNGKAYWGSVEYFSKFEEKRSRSAHFPIWANLENQTSWSQHD